MKIIEWFGIMLILFGGIGTGVAFTMLHYSQNSPETISEPVIKTFKVTAYCPCEKCCGKYADGVTANGYKIKPRDRFIAAPKHIPFGTQLIVPGYNNNQPVPVLDRGGAIIVQCLDVYFDTHQEALNWGVQELPVKVYRDSKE